MSIRDETWVKLATIADNHGVKVADVIDRMTDTLTRPKPKSEQALKSDPNRNRYVLDWIRSGWSDQDTAEATGETKAAVARIRREAGLPANRKHARTKPATRSRYWSDAEHREIRRLHEAGVDEVEISIIFRCSPEQIINKLTRWGLNPKGNNQ
ncbi:MAG TPA: hypothetical protein VFU07_07240 [Candidatus Lumbricidophila sp.]|nr:hypothetical protein [Candidatus Lumbricidophila sp.]